MPGPRLSRALTRHRSARPAGGAARHPRRKRRACGSAGWARGAAMPGRKSSKEKKRRRSRSCCPEGAPGPDGSDRKRRSTESSHGALEVAQTESWGLAGAVPSPPPVTRLESRGGRGPAAARLRFLPWVAREGPGSVALVAVRLRGAAGGRRGQGSSGTGTGGGRPGPGAPRAPPETSGLGVPGVRDVRTSSGGPRRGSVPQYLWHCESSPGCVGVQKWL